jgi:2-polyprenyl-6-methoxyphenol hydroxylase-like FAD-dependent oxidoreductase
VIVGGGPAGLILAIELGRRGVPSVLLEEDPGPPDFPKANATTSRTMEHYRRLGFADEIRALGRAELGERLYRHAAAEFDIPGIHFGMWYGTSPIVSDSDIEPPVDEPHRYVPSSCPGARAPHV